MKQPKPTSQAWRILCRLESAQGGKVSLVQNSSAEDQPVQCTRFELRHKFGFQIENGSGVSNPSHTWFDWSGLLRLLC